jgi:hypothetical protein
MFSEEYRLECKFYPSNWTTAGSLPVCQLRLAYTCESEKLLNPANQVDPFYLVKIAAFLGPILKNLNMLADLNLDLNYSLVR